MCGICGFVSRQNINLEQLNYMNDMMVYRGPDDHGAEIFQQDGEYSVGMAQRRLSILDLSPLGHQPMHSANDRIIVVFNGEIYNFQKLKEQLPQYEFKSTCDTEVLIAAYLEWGIDFVTKLNGMFAIALFDRDTNELFLIRDRIGKKPLYYWYEDQNLVFASELKPILACPGFTREIRTEVLARFLYHQYINAPDSIFRNVYKLEPGCILRFKSGQTDLKKYWDVSEEHRRKKSGKVLTYQESKAEFKEILKTAVKDRMVADVPVGTFLSGGYDSSLVTALAQENSATPVKTFSIGFNEEKYNEATYAKEVARYLGTDHTEMYIGEQEMLPLVDSISKYYDEPFADSSQIPSMLVSDLARQQVTVALSGDGGDEFFCGYQLYPIIGKAKQVDIPGGMLSKILQCPGVRSLNIYDRLPLGVQMIVDNRNTATKTQFGPRRYFELVQRLLLDDGLPIQYAIEDKYGENNWQERRMLLDMDTYLPGDILCKVDRASMKYSLETRCPILDTNVMEYSFHLPHEYKSKGKKQKRILKDIAYEYIPKSLLDRPKVGFAVPLDLWLRGALKDQLLDLSQKDFLQRQNIFHSESVQKLLDHYFVAGDGGALSGENYSKFVWSYFVFQKWYEYYMK